jgi:hypothetical protein
MACGAVPLQSYCLVGMTVCECKVFMMVPGMCANSEVSFIFNAFRL